MLTKCNENCIETVDAAGGISQEIPCDDSVRSNCVVLGEDLNLCSIDVKSTDSLKKIIVAFDKVICGLKNSTIDIFFNDLVVDNCITKEIVTDINNHKTIKLSIDENCLCNTVQSCSVPVSNPFIITSNKYNICGNQVATLTSIYSDTIWYNQIGTQIGTGATKTVSSGGSYYAIHQGKISNVVTIVYNSVCQVYNYTRIKNFYKNCPAGTNSNEYTYSKVYTSEISYQDALHQSELDDTIFNTEGQAIVEATGFCIGNTPTTPVPSGCFNVFLSNANCNVIPTPVPTTPVPTPVGCIGITGLTIVGNSTINPNGTGQYTLSYTGSTPLSYSWSIAGQGTSIISGQNADTVNIQVGSSGNFILTLNVNSCGSTITATKNITLNVVPSSCNISFTISNINCNSPIPTPVITPTVPTPVVPTPVTSNFILTEPNKPSYYFSDGHPASYYSDRSKLPAILTNTSTFDAVNDVVYIENPYLKIGLNLKRGGQICYASIAGSTDNKVYNGYDGGFQWQIDATQNLVGGVIQGQTSGSPQNNVNYNTTMGGDYLNHSQSLIDYHAVPNGYYVKFRPLLYPFNSIISEVEIEVTYTLVGKSLKIDYVYNSFRTDPTVESNSTQYQGWAVPILFMTNDLTNYSTYAGNQPWTNGALTEGVIPNVTDGANPAFGIDAKEYWAVTYNPNNNFAVGAMNISEGGYVRWEQLNKYPGNPPGTVFSGAYTTLSLLASLIIPNGGNYQKSITSYITLGDKSSVIQELRTRAGH